MRKITITIREGSMEEVPNLTKETKIFFERIGAKFQSFNFNKAGEIIINATYDSDEYNTF
jgi:hypothetical protein